MRQELLIPKGMKDATVIVVGLGMLGSWVSHALARSCGHVMGYDFDTVGHENVGTQAYVPVEVGLGKAAALHSHLIGLPFKAFNERFTADMRYGGGSPLVIVSCVDSFEGRRMVAEWAAKHADLFIDTRAHGTVGVVIAATLQNGRDIPGYLATLESDEDAPAPQCGAEGTAFVGMWVAAQVASTMVRFFRGLPYAYKVVQDIGLDATIARVPLEEAVPMT